MEGSAAQQAAGLSQLRGGVLVQGRRTRAARCRALPPAELTAAALPAREPPIRHRISVPTSWLELELREGRNRQVRRMTAAVGLPTLRLIRVAIDLLDGMPPLNLAGLAPGEWRHVSDAESERLERILKPGPKRGAPGIQPSPSRSSRTVCN